MTHSHETYLSLTVPRTAYAGHQLRCELDALYLDIPRDALPTARLLVTELASNALLHGAGATIDLTVERRGDCLRVEVTDDGCGVERPGRGDRQVGGWGLELVDLLSSRWGIERGSTHVWFELPLGRAA